MTRAEGSAGEPLSAMKIASCDLMSRQPRPFKNPFMTLSVTSETARESLVATVRRTSSAANSTVGPM